MSTINIWKIYRHNICAPCHSRHLRAKMWSHVINRSYCKEDVPNKSSIGNLIKMFTWKCCVSILNFSRLDSLSLNEAPELELSSPRPLPKGPETILSRFEDEMIAENKVSSSTKGAAACSSNWHVRSTSWTTKSRTPCKFASIREERQTRTHVTEIQSIYQGFQIKSCTKSRLTEFTIV